MSLPAYFTVKQKLPTGASDPDLGDASNDVSGQQETSAAGLSGTCPTERFRGYFFSAASGPIAFSVSQRSSASWASAPSQTAALSLATSAKPSWISQLFTSSIAADMSAAIVNGQVTYSGFLTLLENVNSKLTSAGLTTAQFNDLKTIVTNLNNGVTTSAYLTGIMKALVMGNTMKPPGQAAAPRQQPLAILPLAPVRPSFRSLSASGFLVQTCRIRRSA